MSTIRQYFDTDFDYALRVSVKLKSTTLACEGAVFYDASANSAFLSFYLPSAELTPELLEHFLTALTPGAIQVELDGVIRLPSGKTFHGQLQIHNTNPLQIQYQLFGDPSWRELLQVPTSRRIFIYTESIFTAEQVTTLQAHAKTIGHELQIRESTYEKERTLQETPLAFISHDSRDKDLIARPIALNLQRKVCPVWYDEYSLALGANLRESIERGLKECKKCVLILSPNFLSNRGWGKKEFESIFTREIIEDSALVLPIWCGVTKEQVYDYSPSLLNVKGIDWHALGENEVCRQIYVATTSATQ